MNAGGVNKRFFELAGHCHTRRLSVSSSCPL
jgi:hypothetical protein